MPRILIAGCGYLGQAVADLSHSQGWEVEGWTASAASAECLSAKPYRVRACDISNWKRAGEDRESFDVVVHSASTRGGNVDPYRHVYLEGARNLLERFPSSRMVFVSSTSAYAQTGGEWVNEKSAAKPEHDTGKILRETEEIILARHGVVARLAGLYGPGRSFLLARFLAGEAVIDEVNDRFVNQVHRDDAAAALFLLVNRETSKGEIYNVVDDQPILQSECYRWLAEKLHRPIPPFGRSTSKRKRGRSNKRVSNAKLRSIGWFPRYPTFAQAMSESILPGL
jgi:nucleoside-diphosphate-sugar epimerase